MKSVSLVQLKFSIGINFIDGRLCDVQRTSTACLVKNEIYGYHHNTPRKIFKYWNSSVGPRKAQQQTAENVHGQTTARPKIII